MSSIIEVPVIKAKGATISIDTERLPEKYYVAALTNGLKIFINGGATKIVKPEDETDAAAMAKYHEAAIAKAQERVEAMMSGKLKLGRAVAAEAGPSGAVMTEARRIARQLVKDTLRDNGLKVSHYSASEITAAANEILASPDGKGILLQAEENLSKRKQTNIALDVSKLAVDPTLVAKAKEASAKKKAKTLSAKQAGKVAPRASKAVH